MAEEFLKSLKRKIWLTRKCRINASERLLRSAKYIEFLNVYYSIFSIVISIICLNQTDNKSATGSLILSVALTISIIYANATGLRERSMALKQNYIDLQILLDQLSQVAPDNSDEIIRISIKYAEILKLSENHSGIDMYKSRKEASEEKLKSSETFKYFLLCAWNLIWKGLLIAAPFSILFIRKMI